MCRFIKDSGERCGNDAEPFCHLHEDTPQSHFYRSMEDLKDDLGDMKDLVTEAETGPSADHGMKMVDATCSECETRLRRTSRVSQHPNQPRRLAFEEVVECDCGEYVLDTRSVMCQELPDGWEP